VFHFDRGEVQPGVSDVFVELNASGVMKFVGLVGSSIEGFSEDFLEVGLGMSAYNSSEGCRRRGFVARGSPCCVSAIAIWLERASGDEDGDGERPTSISGRKSCRMLGSCARNISGSTFSMADVTMS
jgi:hypothetical protein